MYAKRPAVRCTPLSVRPTDLPSAADASFGRMFWSQEDFDLVFLEVERRAVVDMLWARACYAALSVEVSSCHSRAVERL